MSFQDLARALLNDGWIPYFVSPHDPSTATFYHPDVDAYLTDVHEHNGKIIVGPDGTSRSNLLTWCPSFRKRRMTNRRFEHLKKRRWIV